MKLSDFSFQWDQVESDTVLCYLSGDTEPGHHTGVITQFALIKWVQANIKSLGIKKIGVFHQLFMDFC